MENIVSSHKTSPISIAVFITALIIVTINLISLFFPSLITTSLIEGAEIEEISFESGIWLIPVIATNLILLGIGVFYYTKKLPVKIRNAINFIFNFEVSRNVALFVVVTITFFYVGSAMIDSTNDESKQLGDYEGVLRTVENWPYGQQETPSLAVLHVKNFLLKVSLEVFQNIKIIPFLGSISLLLLTYFFTVAISKKRFAGIVAMLILVQSYTFLRFDTVATYSNFWTLFYLLSLYLILNRWYLSPISYFASIFSKPLTAAYLPLTLFFIYRSDISKKKKIRVAIPYLIIFAMILGIIFVGGPQLVELQDFNFNDFWNGFTTWSFQLRYDTIFLLFILPVTVGLYLTSKKGVQYADAILLLIIGVIFAMPLMAGTTTYNLHPYRYVPLIVFFAIGVGMLFSKKITPQV